MSVCLHDAICVLELRGLLYCQHRRKLENVRTFPKSTPNVCLWFLQLNACRKIIKQEILTSIPYALWDCKDLFVQVRRVMWANSSVSGLICCSSFNEDLAAGCSRGNWLNVRKSKRCFYVCFDEWTDGKAGKHVIEWMIERDILQWMTSWWWMDIFVCIILLSILTDCAATLPHYTWHTCCTDSCSFNHHLHLTHDIWATANPTLL